MRNIPPHLTTLLEALKFCGARRDALRTITDSEWKNILSHWGFVRLTLPLRHICGDDLPNWVREQIDQNIGDNTERFCRIRKDYVEIATVLREAGVEHLVLKGFAQWPAYMQSPRFRAQSDIDLFCPEESIFRARDALCTLGYQSVEGQEHFVHQVGDHLTSMVRKTDWQWRGRPFDPEAPISIELHFRFWNKPFLRLDPAGVEQFWPRRVERKLEDFSFPALNPVDSLGYSTLHMLRHLLLGGMLAYHVYELSWFLHTSADNEPFWKQWREWHHDSLRSFEAVCFRLASDWFACRLPEEAKEEIGSLPQPVQQWFQNYRDSPIAWLIRPNKDALWLHLSLLKSPSDKRRILCRGLFPIGTPPTKSVMGWPLRIYRRFFLHVISRVSYHLRLLPLTLWQGFRWWWSGKGLGKQFWILFAASSCFDIGMVVFFSTTPCERFSSRTRSALLTVNSMHGSFAIVLFGFLSQ